jgi:hypothetical protein
MCPLLLTGGVAYFIVGPIISIIHIDISPDMYYLRYANNLGRKESRRKELLRVLIQMALIPAKVPRKNQSSPETVDPVILGLRGRCDKTRAFSTSVSNGTVLRDLGCLMK